MASLRKNLMISITLLVTVVLIVYGGINIYLTKNELETQAKNTIYIQSVQLNQLLDESNNNANLLEKAMLEGYDNTIVAATKLAVSVFNHTYKKYLNGEYPSEAAAQKDALGIVRDMWYGPVGYFWTDNDKYFLLEHALTPEKEGMNRYNMTDMTGFYLLRNITGNAIKYGPTFTNYKYAKPGFDPKLEFTKRGYSEYFAPWGWVPGTGNYIDDINAKKKIYMDESSALFKGKLNEISKDGEAYVLDDNGIVLYHAGESSQLYETGKKAVVVDRISGRQLFDILSESKNTYVTYNLGGKDILAYVGYNTNDKVYTVVGKDYAKLMSVVTSLKYFMISILALAILIAFGVSYYISVSISRPIKQLKDAAEKVTEGDFDVKLPTELKYDEIRMMTASLEMLISAIKQKKK